MIFAKIIMLRYKNLFAALLIAITLSSLLPPEVFLRRANAQLAVDIAAISIPALPVKDVTSSPELTAANTTNKNIFDTLEKILKIALEALRKRILNMLADQIIQHIQGGGDPRYVDDWRLFLKDAGDAAFGDFLKQVGFDAICDPFKLQIQLALYPVPTFNQPVTCTLTQVINNVNNFLNDFKSGGWIGYTSFTRPQNNFFGVFVSYRDAAVREAIKAKEAALNQAVGAGGFLDNVDCSEPSVCSANPSDPSCAAPDKDRDGVTGDIQSTCITTTPGETIGLTVSQALNLDIPYVINSGELAAYIGAIADAYINKLIISGVSGLQGISTSNAPSGGYFPGGSGPCPGLSGAALAACLNYNNVYNNSFSSATSSLIQQIDQTITPRAQASTTVENTSQMLQSYGPSTLYWYGQVQNAGPFCDKQTYLKDINGEAQWATTTLASVINDQTTNNSIIAQLTSYKQQVLALAPGDWIGYSAIAAQIQASGLIDPVGAIAFKDAAKAQNQFVLNKTTKNLTQTFPGYVTDCNNIP